jgi:predicted DsbA family dithiol-disulfide isomerase
VQTEAVQTLTIDFVSDVSCPWCIIGLKALEQALTRLRGEVEATVTFQPFELNPHMPPGGQDIAEHLHEKYGATPEQSAHTRAMIAERGAALGFTFALDQRSRIYNTFDAHRLLHWAHEEGRQRALKLALFDAYFTQGQDVSDHEVLCRVAAAVGLDGQRARAILESEDHAAAVRAAEQQWQRAGIHSVPAIVINQRHLISGGQPPEVFEQALRQIAREG